MYVCFKSKGIQKEERDSLVSGVHSLNMGEPTVPSLCAVSEHSRSSHSQKDGKSVPALKYSHPDSCGHEPRDLIARGLLTGYLQGFLPVTSKPWLSIRLSVESCTPEQIQDCTLNAAIKLLAEKGQGVNTFCTVR